MATKTKHVAAGESAKSTETGAEACRLAKSLSDDLRHHDFSEAVPWVYNPLDYAWAAHEQYLNRYARDSCKVLMIGMNPGPWGMAQTGVPFGEIPAVRDFLGIDARVGKPDPEHPKRIVEGLECSRSEVSGRRLWGLFAERFVDADSFFEEHFVTNYCPLVFMEESARNVTPDKLPAKLRNPLEERCDLHLAKLIQLLKPKWLIGVGAFAENCAKRIVKADPASFDDGLQIGRILHPSPASPAANKDWAGTATKQLIELGLWSE